MSDNTQKKILIVDDEQYIRILYSKYLQEKDLSGIPVEDGHQALAEIGKGDYALAIIDLYMPKMSGFKLIESIRSSNLELKDIPIIVITGFDSDEVRDKCQDLGVFEVLTKPVTLEDYGTTVFKALDKAS